MTILLTGFEPFGKVAVNPSEQIVKHIAQRADDDIVTAILPVDYVQAGAQLLTHIEHHQPDAILLLGVAQRRDSINLERIAININDASIADNAGTLVRGNPIAADAPVGYWSTLPLNAMYDAIAESGIRVKFSNHAGAYLCNHVFYVVRHHDETNGNATRPTGFIHLPAMGDEAPNMPLKDMLTAIDACLTILKKQIAQPQV